MANYYFESIMQPFDFGKYRGMTLEEILKINPSYIYWCVWNILDFHITDNALSEISKLFPKFIVSSEFAQRNKQMPELEEDYYDDDCVDEESYMDSPTYSRYNGSYAQDEMGYSDDEIDTIFDGDPDAYWNID